MLTFQQTRQMFDYDASTGDLIWKPRDATEFKRPQDHSTWHKRFCGQAAGGHIGSGYRAFGFGGKLYPNHRVVWLWHHGTGPRHTVDHINGDRTDNRIENLRDVTHKTNCRNMARPSTNTSGHIGVFWFSRDAKWYATINTDGVRRHLGSFRSKDDAIVARQEAEILLGFHENHGRDNSMLQSRKT